LNTLVNFESAQPSQSDQFSVGVNNGFTEAVDADGSSVFVRSKGQLAVEKNRQYCVSMTQQTSGFVDESGPYNFSV
jgi:hypothetical protein